MGSFDEYVRGAFDFDYMIDSYYSPVPKVETKNIKLVLSRNLSEASQRKNSLIQNEIWPNETLLDLKGSRCDIILRNYKHRINYMKACELTSIQAYTMTVCWTLSLLSRQVASLCRLVSLNCSSRAICVVKTWVMWDEKDGSVWVGRETGAVWSWLLKRSWLAGPVEFNEELGGWAVTRSAAGWVVIGSIGVGTSMGSAGTP